MTETTLNGKPTAAEEAVGLLLREPDALRRYQLLREVEQQLPRLRALCAAELAAQGQSMEQVGQLLGLSRAQVTATLREHGLPRPRELHRTDADRSIAWHFGVLLALYREVAEGARPRDGADLWGKRFAATLAGAALPAWEHDVHSWMRALRRRDVALAERLAGEIDDQMTRISGLPEWLSLAEHSEVMVACHATRHRRRG